MSSPGSTPRDVIALALELAPTGTLVVDEGGTIVLMNREAERLFGWSRDELIGQPVEFLVPERYRRGHPAMRSAFLASPEARPMGAGRMLHGLRKDGSEVPVEIGLNPVRDAGQLLVIASVVDISARQAAESALRESEEGFRLLVDGVQDYAILMLDAEGRVASWNAGAQRVFGYEAAEILGRDFATFFTEADAAAGRPHAVLDQAAGQGRVEEEAQRVRKDGRRFLASSILTALRAQDGSLRGFAKIMRDVTERHHLEEQLRQSQKMEAIGTLAGGIAHDFNNLLNAIVGYAELARDASNDLRVRADLDRVLQGAERGRQLVLRILTFSRGQQIDRVPTRLHGPVGEALQLLRASLPASLEMREHLDPTAPVVTCNETQVHQVVMNLASNAAHACQAGGVLDVSLVPFLVDAELARNVPGLQPGPHALLSVADTGKGMSPEVLARATEPFFTTKAAGRGTGLGLSVVHGIVQAHGGAMRLRSRPGEGTTVEIFLPATPGAAVEDEAKPAAPAEGPHLLVVDDEEVLANLARRQLEARGFRVTMHVSSLDALADFQSRPHAFDLVMTDNLMPRMTGAQLAAEISRLRPGMPLLMVSGHGDDMTPDQRRTAGITALLRKPYTSQQLLDAIHAILPPGGDAVQ